MSVAPQQNYEPGPAQPPHHPQPGYSTAPPWAPAPAVQQTPAGQYPPAGQYGQYQPPAVAPYQHGQLLVAFPEEMTNAGRPKPPAWWPVVVFTFFFSVFGAISAARRAGRARRGRGSAAPYWIAFVATLAAASLIWNVAVAAAVPIYLDYREGIVTEAVQSNLVHDGRLEKSAGLTVTAATCTPKSDRGPDGLRSYDCLLTLGDGRAGSLTVRADSAGEWTILKGR